MAASTVQHVAKASSDQLLRKFADVKPDKPRQRKRARPVRGDSNKSGTLVEQRSLLRSANPKTEISWQRKAKKLDLRSRVRNRFILAMVKKTWNHTMEIASKMLLEKHCNKHVRLRNEAA